MTGINRTGDFTESLMNKQLNTRAKPVWPSANYAEAMTNAIGGSFVASVG